MAKESVNILKDKIDIVDLLAQLNAALSEEWLAFYQYWVGSFVVEGAMRGDVQREFQEHAAEAGIAVGVDGLFMETHEDPSVAKSDGANMLKLDLLEGLLTKLVRIRQVL